MVTKELIRQALQPIIDPEYKASVVDLNLVKDVVIKENRISLTCVLTSSDEVYKASLQSQIQDALAAVGADQIHIRFREITDYEKNQFAELGNAPVSEGSEGSDAAQSQHAAAPLLDPQSPVQFIAIASGKGGVGKSTVTANLAVALARLGKKVGIMDADIYGFSIPDMMGIEEQPQLIDNRIHPVVKFGVKVISMGFFVEDNSPVIWRGPMLGKMLHNFFHEVDWGELDYLLLDLPPGTGDIALDLHQLLPQSKEILVTTPHATAAFVAARAGAMAVQTQHDIIGVVENMAYYECSKCGEKDYVFGRGGGAMLAEQLHTKLLAQIPLGAPVNHVSEADFSPSVYKADSKSGGIYLELAANVIEELQKN
ncbi:Mrp/NBP35 family ATP-binding protein [Paenibacillus sp. FJAT-26967]|uniref:Mrp/NBP35 family ATP-binding protein n=1 Tax=Paenibacillus sp. FJAT-26967 TaxID=1729690 RepID=UPI00083890B5|nr:Mrp/NBP35 family ATP-binding protein [Paenibacillus sp. FJAT-26967]